MDETTTQTLIERFDSRISSHIGAIISIAFGAFTILTLLQGKVNDLLSLPVFFLFTLEIFVFPFAVMFCLFRAFHYSMAIEVVKSETKLGVYENDVCGKALEEMPYTVQMIIAIRKRFRTPKVIKTAIPIAYLLWLITILSVLYLAA